MLEITRSRMGWLIGMCLLLGAAACKKAPPKAPPPPEIPVVEVIQKDVPIEKDYVGQVYGIVDIPIRARVEGFLEGIHFSEGRPVKRGQHLYSIDPQPFQAQVARMKSELAQAKIAAVKAQTDLNRIEPLAEINAVSQSDLDAAVAEKGAADAAVEAAEAALRMSEIELGYTRISAPISGIIGKTEAKVGEFVGKSPNPVILNTISRIDSFRVEFFLTEQDYLALARAFMRGAAHEIERRNPAEEEKLRLILADGSIFGYKGNVDFVNREVDPTTGSLLVQASFPNPNLLIRPGQYGKVRAIINIVEGALLVPQRCVKEFQGEFSLFVVNDSSVVEERTVTLGPKYQDLWIVREGIEPGDKVVLEGLQKVRDNAPINAVLQEFTSKYEDP